MGNSESSLAPYRYNFKNPRIGDFDLSKIEVFKIDDEQSCVAAKEYLVDAQVLYVDCEGHCFGSWNQKLGVVQVATGLDRCFVFHITKYKDSLDFLKNLFESDHVRKVFHDCSGDSAVLFHENEIFLSCESVDDTQIAQKVIQSRKKKKPIDRTSGSSLAYLYQFYCGKQIPGNKQFDKSDLRTRGENMWTDNLELSDGMMKYCVVDALALCEIFYQQEKLFERDSQYRELIKEQLGRKIRNSGSYEEQDMRMQESESSDWDLLALVGRCFCIRWNRQK